MVSRSFRWRFSTGTWRRQLHVPSRYLARESGHFVSENAVCIQLPRLCYPDARWMQRSSVLMRSGIRMEKITITRINSSYRESRKCRLAHRGPARLHVGSHSLHDIDRNIRSDPSHPNFAPTGVRSPRLGVGFICLGMWGDKRCPQDDSWVCLTGCILRTCCRTLPVIR